jgi:hypothetical protein
VILCQSEKYSLVPELVETLMNYAKIFNSKKQKKKYKYLLPLKQAGFSKKEALYFGFKVSKWLWDQNISKKRNNGGRPKINALFTEKIRNFFLENSTEAANRFLKLQGKNAMYRRFTFIDAYREFMYKENISLSSFKKYVPHNIKKPHRLSDLCAYCQQNKVYN